MLLKSISQSLSLRNVDIDMKENQFSEKLIFAVKDSCVEDHLNLLNKLSK